MHYIYENEDWPNFYWDNEKILVLLGKVKKSQGFLLGKMSQWGFDVQNQALLQILTENVLKSSEIEGDIFNREQVRSSVARRLGLKLPTDTQMRSNNYIDGAVEILADATQDYKQSITPKRIFGWHAALFPTGYSGMFKIKVGKYRTDLNGPMQVVSGYIGREIIHYEAPKASVLKIEMRKFFDYLNQNDNEDFFIKAAIVHLWFTTLHPFEDGNGRIARALTEIFLSRSDDCGFRFYSMCSQIMKERQKYYEILENTQKGSMDVTNWIIWFLNNLQRAIESSDEILRKVIHAASFWMKYSDIIFNERQKKILNLLLNDFQGNLTTTKWAKICKCSQDTATRDIKELLSKNLFEKQGKAKNTHYILRI